MNIQPVVEGYGEVSAVPVLLRRLREEAVAYPLEVNPPIRKHRNEFFDESLLRKAVRLAKKQEDCGAILILVDGDGDNDCPKTDGPTLQAWAQAEAGQVPCGVVIAYREYEAWFLAAMESLRGKRGIRDDASPHPSPETPKGAKEQVEQRLVPGRSYSPTTDQAALSAVFDLAVAYRCCRSFRRFVKVFGLLAAGAGATPANPWPPPAW